MAKKPRREAQVMTEVELKKAAKWLKRMKRIIDAMPDGIEVHLGYGYISMYRQGTLENHMKSQKKNGWGIDDDLCMGSEATTNRLIPYSEAT